MCFCYCRSALCFTIYWDSISIVLFWYAFHLWGRASLSITRPLNIFCDSSTLYACCTVRSVYRIRWKWSLSGSHLLPVESKWKRVWVLRRPIPLCSWSSRHRLCVATANSYAQSLEMPLTTVTRTGKENSLGAVLCMLQSNLLKGVHVFTYILSLYAYTFVF